MNPAMFAMVLEGIRAAQVLADKLTVSLQSQPLTTEQKEAILHARRESQVEWNDAVAAAKMRLGDGE